MSRNLIFALVAITSTSGLARAEGDVSCSTHRDYPKGGAYTADLSLSVNGDAVKLVSFSTCTSNGKEGGGYCCSLSPDDTFKEVWSYRQKGRVTVLSIKTEFREEGVDRVEIERTKKGWQVRFVDVDHGRCGFGADFPEVVTIVDGSSTCHVHER